MARVGSIQSSFRGAQGRGPAMYSPASRSTSRQDPLVSAMEAARTLPTSTTSLNRRIRKSKEWMALSAPLSNCSTRWHKRAKKNVAEKSAQRFNNFARLALLRLIEMEIAVVLAQANGNSEQIGEMLLGKDSRLGFVREDAPFAQKDHAFNFWNDF